MYRAYSRDGTPIAFDRTGRGPALIVVDGALCYRASGPSRKLAAALSQHFTVITYDRRGRGVSGNTLPYSIDREVDDLQALILDAGGAAFVYGMSSGAALALEAANRGLGIRKLALFEAPFIVDDSRAPLPDDFLARLEAAIASNRRGHAVRLFLTLVGLSPLVIAVMRVLPTWSKLTAVAHTLPYDIMLVEDNERGRPLRPTQWAGATVPALVMVGGKSPAWMQNAMRALADVLPNADLHTLEGETHMVSASVQAAPLVEFFKGYRGASTISHRASELGPQSSRARALRSSDSTAQGNS